MKTAKLLFYLKKCRTNKSTGLIPIYARITEEGCREEISIRKSIKENEWDKKTHSAKGSKEEAMTLNTFLNSYRHNFDKYINQLMLDGKIASASAIKKCLIGKNVNRYTLVQAFAEHNSDFESNVGIKYEKSTFNHYKNSLKKIQNFLHIKFNRSDIPLEDLNHVFITNFDNHLRKHDQLSKNSAAKHLKNLKKIIKFALVREWISRDPFMNFKCSYDILNVQPLTAHELDLLENKKFTSERLDIVRDSFVFSVYTSLAFCDQSKLKRSKIGLGDDNKYWIIDPRKKTETLTQMPLLNKAFEIMNKYKDHPICEVKD